MGFGYLARKKEIKEEIKEIVNQFKDWQYEETLSSWDNRTPRFSVWLQYKKDDIVVTFYGNCDEKEIFDECGITITTKNGYSSMVFNMEFSLNEVSKILESVGKFERFANEFVETLKG